MANHRAADRPHQIADREHAERRQQLRGMVLARKEMLSDRADKIAVDREILPFERVADHAGNNDLAPACGLQSADSLAAVEFSRAAGNRGLFSRP